MKKATRALLAIAIAVLAAVSLLTFTACKCNHEWSEWTVLTAATCETDGAKTRKCSKCDNVEIDKVESLGHNYVNSVCTNCNDDISTKGLQYVAGAEENTCVVAGIGTAVATDIIIPDVYQGKKVVGIKDKAFRGSNIRSVEIPDSVTSIGDGAFYECRSLTSITIGSNVTSIGNEAFYNCRSLTSITIPNSVTSIGNYAFSYCSSLTSITLPNSVTSIGDGAFSFCSNLTSITIPNSVTSIGESAFV